MENLAKRKCVPCEGGIPPLPDEKIARFHSEVPDWSVEEESGHKKIAKEFKFKSFKEAVGFTNKVAKIAEGEGHHPDIYIFYNKVRLSLYTHAISGLHDNDFILAAKINQFISR